MLLLILGFFLLPATFFLGVGVATVMDFVKEKSIKN